MPSVFDDNLGVLFIGITVAGVLWGVTTSQAFHYSTTRSQDVIGIKLLVFTIWTLDTTLQMILFVNLYDYCVTNFGKVFHLLEVPKTATIATTIIAVQALMVQCFYMSKIWKLSERNKLLMTSVTILFVTQVVFASMLIHVSATTTSNNWITVLEEERISGVTFAGLGFVTDSVITISISTLLHRRKTEFAETKSMIGRLIIFFATTNMLTALCQLAKFIVYLKYPHKFYIMAMSFIVIQLYANSFLAALNMRPYMRQSHSVKYTSSEPAEWTSRDISPGQSGGGGSTLRGTLGGAHRGVRAVNYTSTQYDGGLGLPSVHKKDSLV